MSTALGRVEEPQDSTSAASEEDQWHCKGQSCPCAEIYLPWDFCGAVKAAGRCSCHSVYPVIKYPEVLRLQQRKMRLEERLYVCVMYIALSSLISP